MLRWQDVDLIAGRLTIRQNVVRGIVGTPKSGKPREILRAVSAPSYDDCRFHMTSGTLSAPIEMQY
ncbi:MAG TPA: hypothetical protein VF403_15715 [Kofleriaceae bacterium]